MLPHPASQVPTLRTARLRLVAPAASHFEAFSQWHADDETMQYIGDGKPLDRVGAWLHLAMLIGHWQLRGYGVWILEHATSGELAGRVGLLHPEGWPEPELNWMIVPAMRGQGMATEAARCALDFAFNVLGFASVVSLVRPENMVSGRVATRLGGTPADVIDFMQGSMQVYRYQRQQ